MSMENELFLLRLEALGSHYGLDISIDCAQLFKELQPFKNDWKTYSPHKPGYGREGLSVTSLDGELSGFPDLTSLYDYNREHGTQWSEMSFRKFTRVASCPSLAKLLEAFGPFLGRSHFLRLNRGGHFPFHRDIGAEDEYVFRIFVPIYGAGAYSFVFLLGQERIFLESGTPYFINTRMEHALFSFTEESIHLVLNVEANSNSYNVVRRLLMAG